MRASICAKNRRTHERTSPLLLRPAETLAAAKRGRASMATASSVQFSSGAQMRNRIPKRVRVARSLVAIQFGGCGGRREEPFGDHAYTVRLYRPRMEILCGRWKFPEPQPVG